MQFTTLFTALTTILAVSASALPAVVENSLEERSGKTCGQVYKETQAVYPGYATCIKDRNGNSARWTAAWSKNFPSNEFCPL
jgi:hypothetical protein